jgi:cell division protein FtsB
MRRAAVLLIVALAAVGVLLLFVFPARTLLAQQHQISATESHISALTRENSELATRIRSMKDPTQIEQIAHEQYGLVMPGQQAYTIIPKVVPRTKLRVVAKPAAKPHHWWQDLEFWH